MSGVGLVLAALGLAHFKSKKDRTQTEFRDEYAVIQFLGTDDHGAVQSAKSNLNVQPFQSQVVARSPPRRGDQNQ